VDPVSNPEIPTNPEAASSAVMKLPCVLALDTSYSMGLMEGSGSSPIDELNAGYEVFRNKIDEHPLARKMVEVAIVTFGGSVNLAQPFQEARYLSEQHFHAEGDTPMGGAVKRGIDELTSRKLEHKRNGNSYVRPWLIVISDGAPTDGEFEESAKQLREYEAAKGTSVFPIGVGAAADLSALAKLSQHRSPLLLRSPAAFTEFFLWLCEAMIAGSTSAQGEMLALPPVSAWSGVPM
jgi:uncharacterized protein YegL